MSYYIKEAYSFRKVTLHHHECHFCNNGMGTAGQSVTETGRWHGPYASVDGAERHGRQLQPKLSRCGRCLKETPS